MDFADVFAALRGILVHESQFVPLTRTYRPTGAVMADVACVRIDGRLYFHPQRLAEFRAALARPPAATAQDIARWLDDGGPATAAG